MWYARRTTSRRLTRARGMAMVLVICVMALAAILGYAMLGASAVQATASNNGVAASIAQAQAESGIHLAMYYLMNPQNVPPGLNTTGVANLLYGYWPGANNITFSTTGLSPVPMPPNVPVTVPPNVSVTVQPASPPPNAPSQTYFFTVTSIGSSGTIGGGAITRTITAQIQVNTAYLIQQAAAFNQNVSLNKGVTITGSPDAIRSIANVTIGNYGTVSGNIRAPSEATSFLGHWLSGSLQVAPSLPPSPTSSDVNYYGTYTYQGKVYAAVQLPNSTLSPGTLPTLDPVNNPLNVFWYNGDVTVTGGVSFTGTLVVKGGNLIVQGAGSTITASSGMPALVIDKQLQLKNTNQGLTVNGVVCAQGGIGSAGGPNTGCAITINGALLVNSTNVTPPLNATLTVTYSAALASAPGLSSTNQVPQSVKIVSWSQ